MIQSQDIILDAMKLLSLPEPSLFELEEIIESGMSCAMANKPADVEDLGVPGEPEGINLTVQYLIAGSERLRQSILKVDTDPVDCTLLKTHLVQYISKHIIKALAHKAREIDVTRKGKSVYASDSGERSWFVLVTGKLKATLIQPEEEEEQSCEIMIGDAFGGYMVGDDVDHMRVEVVEPSKYIELRWDDLERIEEDEENSTSKLMAILGTNSWNHLSCRGHQMVDLFESEQEDAITGSVGLGSRLSLMGSFKSETSIERKESLPASGKSDSSRRASNSSRRASATVKRGSLFLHGEPLQAPYTEPELDEIKTAFSTIHSLWQDISMGADSISMSQLTAVHENLGEIGSELFSQLFLSKSMKKNEVSLLIQ